MLIPPELVPSLIALRASGASYKAIQSHLSGLGIKTPLTTLWSLLRRSGAPAAHRRAAPVEVAIPRRPSWRHVRWLYEEATGRSVREIAEADGVSVQAVASALANVRGNLYTVEDDEPNDHAVAVSVPPRDH